jgi:hypothetical protein
MLGPNTVDGVFRSDDQRVWVRARGRGYNELVSLRRGSLQSGVRELVGVERFQSLSDEGLWARPQRAEDPSTAEGRA